MGTLGVSQDTITGNLTVQGNFIQPAIVDGVTAKASGGQQTSGVSVIPTTTTYFRVTTVASAGDSVTLPPIGAIGGGPGDEIVVYNSTATNAMNVFPALGDNINLLSANTAFSIPAGKSASFVATSLTSAGTGRWMSLLSA